MSPEWLAVTVRAVALLLLCIFFGDNVHQSLTAARNARAEQRPDALLWAHAGICFCLSMLGSILLVSAVINAFAPSETFLKFARGALAINGSLVIPFILWYYAMKLR